MYKKTKKNTEKELYRKLYLGLMGIVLTIVLIIVSLKYFTPQIGSIFGWLSINKNSNAPEDTLIPRPPLFSNVPEAVQVETVKLNGISEPGSSVDLYVNGPKKSSTTTDSDGMFTFTDVRLHLGKNIIFAKAKDQAKNESPKSEIVYITVDKTKPEIKIFEPIHDSTIKNGSKRVKVRGTVNEKATVRINGKLAIVKPDLTFEFLLGVNEGEVFIKIEATDEAGNMSEEGLTVKYEK